MSTPHDAVPPAPQWQALAAAGHVGDEALARGAMHHPHPAARELALGALQRMGVLTDHEVATAMADPDAAVRRRGLRLAATRPAIELLGALHDPDPTVVEVAAWAAGEHEQVADAVVERLCAVAVEATDALVREAAVAALGAIGDPRGLPAILAGCTDKPAIRRRAVLALAPFEGPEVDAALEAARSDHDWQVRQSAEDISPG